MNKKNIKTIIIAAAVVVGFTAFSMAVSADNKVGCVDYFDAKNQTESSVTLEWDKGMNADGYVIYRADSKTNGEYVKYIEFNNPDIITFTDTNIDAGRRYNYQIRSYVNYDGEKVYSKAESVRTASSPVEVSKLTVASQNPKSISLKWNKSDGATGYTVYRMDYQSNGKYKKICDVKGTEQYNDKELTSSHKYYYYVAAYREVDGEKSYSKNGAIIKTATTPSQVQNLETIVKKTNSLTISWDESPNASGYVIYRMSKNENEYEGEWVYDEYEGYIYNSNVGSYVKHAVIKDGKKTTYTDKELYNCQAYSYRVVPYYKADNKYYYGDYRQVATGTVTETPKVEAFSRTNRIMAKWYPVDGAEGYAVYLSENKNGPFKLQGTTDDTIYLTKQLTENKKYYVRVCAYYSADKKTEIYSNFTTEEVQCTSKNRVYKYEVDPTYIEIDLDMQHMWYYENGKLVISTPVVTGMKYARDTTTGLYNVYNKESPARLVGETWDTDVNYWMAVTYDGIGIHDSVWRYNYEYGGNTYTYDGSHGCINTPFDKVQEMYQKVKVGTPVVIYEKSEDHSDIED